jgi:hypothetical protein
VESRAGLTIPLAPRVIHKIKGKIKGKTDGFTNRGFRNPLAPTERSFGFDLALCKPLYAQGIPGAKLPDSVRVGADPLRSRMSTTTCSRGLCPYPVALDVDVKGRCYFHGRVAAELLMDAWNGKGQGYLKFKLPKRSPAGGPHEHRPRQGSTQPTVGRPL